MFETPPESSFGNLFSEPEEVAEESIEPEKRVDVDKDSEALKIEQNTRIMESIEDINLFDLDLDQLTEDQDNQAELKILESVEDLQEGYDAAPAIAKPEVFERPPLDELTPKGMTGLFTRSRDFLDRDHENPPQSTMVESGEGVELWEDPSFQQSDVV